MDRMHADCCRINLVAFPKTVGGQLLEDAFRDHEVLLVGDVENERADEYCVIVDEAVGTDDYLELAIHRPRSTFDLNRDVTPIGHPVQARVKAAVEQRQTNVK